MNMVNRSAIDEIKCIAAVMVFMLHSTIFEEHILELLQSSKFAFVFVPSAWAGVWIFFVVGGYLAGVSFSSGRYQLIRKDVLRYYKNRINKTVVPTIIYILLCVVLVYPTFINNIPSILCRFMFFSYNGSPGVDGIGATWYVSQMIFFYLITPLLAFIFNYFKNRFRRSNYLLVALLFLCIGLGGGYRIIGYNMELDWYSKIYTPWNGNIDLFLSGFIFSFITPKENERFCRQKYYWLSRCTIIITILLNCFFYRRMMFGDLKASIFCMYIFPTLYIVTVLFYLLMSKQDRKVNDNTFSKMKKSIVKKFASITFEFYLFHSLVLHLWASYLQQYLNTSNPLGHIVFLLIVATITIFLSILYRKIFSKSNIKNCN